MNLKHGVELVARDGQLVLGVELAQAVEEREVVHEHVLLQQEDRVRAPVPEVGLDAEPPQVLRSVARAHRFPVEYLDPRLSAVQLLAHAHELKLHRHPLQNNGK